MINRDIMMSGIGKLKVRMDVENIEELADSLTQEERSKIAKKAADARWR